MALPQKILFDSGNELAATAAKQINYHVMGYFPITPSTQIAEYLDALKTNSEHDILLIPADGEHGAAGICYGASAGGGRVFNATSANGLLYALEQLPVQSGTRLPMVLNVACRTVSGPLSIKGDQSDIMYALNTGWVILFANNPQEVYDMNICGLKIAEAVKLPVIVAFDGFFTSHQKRKVYVFENDKDVQNFLGEYKAPYSTLDFENPVTIGAYMNEPDLLNNKYQLHLAMEEAKAAIPSVFEEYEKVSGRRYQILDSYQIEDADVILFTQGSAYDTARAAVDILRKEGKKAGAISTHVLRPWYGTLLSERCKHAKSIVVADRQDSYGAGGGNLTIELKAALQGNSDVKVISRVYGLSGRDFYLNDALHMFNEGFNAGEGKQVKVFDYFGHYPGGGKDKASRKQYFKPIDAQSSSPEAGTLIKDLTAMPKRWAPGHGACPGCGIPVNVNLLLKGIEGNVVLLFQTGCGMVVSTPYPKTSFRVPYIHNLFQNGAATLSGLVEVCHQKQKRGEMEEGDCTFIMISGDGGLDIGMGAAIGTALRNHCMIIFEYDNGGYMNTGYQLSYSTPKGATSSTSHGGKQGFHKDNPQIFAGTHIPYIATVAESNPVDFVKKAAKAAKFAKNHGLVYMKSLSACPLNWGDNPRYERSVIEGAVNCCYHPLYEIEEGITKLSYDPEARNKKIPASEWFGMMGRTKKLTTPEFAPELQSIQKEINRRWQRLRAQAESPYL